jgi:undecaprenyl-diphosphatase
MNRACERRLALEMFAVVSRLGDGAFWYGLMLALPLIHGAQGGVVSAWMLATGALGTAIYRLLKDRLVRERPYALYPLIRAGARALDRYSFPSGHTLHAVSLTLLATDAFPMLGIVLWPFTALVAASRIVLGLHFPSDVVAGAAIGTALALLAFAAGA